MSDILNQNKENMSDILNQNKENMSDILNQNDYYLLESAIENGLDVSDGMLLLETYNPELLKLLLDNGANPFGKDILYHFIGYESCFNLLLKTNPELCKENDEILKCLYGSNMKKETISLTAKYCNDKVVFNAINDDLDFVKAVLKYKDTIYDDGTLVFRLKEFEVVKFLIEKGLDISPYKKDPKFVYYLDKTLYDYEDILWFYENGFDVNQQDEQGRTYIFSFPYSLETLVKKYGANINHVDKKGMSYLDHVIDINGDDYEYSEEAIKLGAVVSEENIYNAVIAGHYVLLDVFKKYVSLDVVYDGLPIIMHAVYSDSNTTKMIRYLLETGVDPNAVDKNGDTLFWRYTKLVDMWTYEEINLLMDYGLNINIGKENLLTSNPIEDYILDILLNNDVDEECMKVYLNKHMNYHLNEGHFNTIETIIEMGLYDVNQKNFLFSIIYSAPTDVARTVIENATDLNVIDANGRNLLFFTFEIEIFSLLIKRGLNINHKDNYGDNVLLSYIKNYSNYDKSLIDIMITYGTEVYSEVFTTLIENNNFETLKQIGEHFTTDFTSFFITAIDKNRYDILEFLVSENTDLDITEAMNFAISLECKDSISSLLKSNFIKKEDFLLAAARTGNTEIVDMFLTDENINIVDKYHENILFVAARNGYTDLVRHLISKGINTEQVNFRGKTYN